MWQNLFHWWFVLVATDLSGDKRLVYNLLVAVITIHLEDTIMYFKLLTCFFANSRARSFIDNFDE